MVQQSKEKVSKDIRTLVESKELSSEILERILINKLVDKVADKVQEIRKNAV
jgi:hypothetical protein